MSSTDWILQRYQLLRAIDDRLIAKVNLALTLLSGIRHMSVSGLRTLMCR